MILLRAVFFSYIGLLIRIVLKKAKIPRSFGCKNCACREEIKVRYYANFIMSNDRIKKKAII